MIAAVRRELSPADLSIVLALVRATTLAGAGLQPGVKAPTVLRAIQRMERALGQSLFERLLCAYMPTELVIRLAGHAQPIKTERPPPRAAFAAPGRFASAP